MEFGDEKWFEKLELMGTFPSDYVFYLSKDRRVMSLCLKSNVKDVSNLRYKTIRGWQGAILNVINCKTPQDYYEECKKLMGDWT